MIDLKDYIAAIPDFPKPGILFRDITPLLQNPEAFKRSIDIFLQHLQDKEIEAIAAIDARGFLFAGPLALRLDVPLLLVRKNGKLPGPTVQIEYDLEYGSNAIEMHSDSVLKGQRVLIIDDLLATGGTAAAAAKLIEKMSGVVVGLAFLIELEGLGGRDRIGSYPITSLLTF